MLPEARWDIHSSRFGTHEGFPYWSAEFHSFDDPAPYAVTLAYGGSDPPSPGLPQIALCVPLPEAPGGWVTVTLFEPAGSVRCLELKAGNRLRICRWFGPESNPPDLEEEMERNDFDPESHQLAQAVLTGDERGAAKSRMVRLCAKLLSPGPIGPAEETISLREVHAKINGKVLVVPPTENRASIPARRGDTLSLSLRFFLRRRTPLLDRIDSRDAALPAYALVQIARERTLSTAEPGPTSGEFRFRPATLTSEIHAGFSVQLPLRPPGDGPSLHGDLLFQSRTFPPVSAVPPDLPPEAIPREVLRHALAAYDPDEGTVPEASREDLLRLLAMFPGDTEDHRIIAQAIEREPTRTFRTPPLGVGWSENYARAALHSPSFAPSLADRMRSEPEPRTNALEESEKGGFVEPQEPDWSSPMPHALAIAALVLADTSAYTDLLRDQLAHLRTKHFSADPEDWAMEDWDADQLIGTGEGLKVVGTLSSEGEARSAALSLLDPIRRECRRRFLETSLSLHQRIGIAGILSPHWCPYVPGFETAPPRVVLNADFSPEERSTLQLLYESSLERAIDLARTFKPPQERAAWVEEILAEWREYLTTRARGLLPRGYESKMSRDRARALREIRS